MDPNAIAITQCIYAMQAREITDYNNNNGRDQETKRGWSNWDRINGSCSAVFLVWWDRQLRRKLEAVNINLKLHKRYVDDSNVAGSGTPIGARYDGEQLIVNEESIAENRELEKDH